MLQGGDRRSRGPCSKLSAQPPPTSGKSVHAFALPLCGDSIPTLLPWKGIMKTNITGSFRSQSRPSSLGPSASVFNGSLPQSWAPTLMVLVELCILGAERQVRGAEGKETQFPPFLGFKASLWQNPTPSAVYSGQIPFCASQSPSPLASTACGPWTMNAAPFIKFSPHKSAAPFSLLCLCSAAKATCVVHT